MKKDIIDFSAKCNTSAENFNDANLASLVEYINEPVKTAEHKVYTMIQVNSPCKVKVTSSSRKKCIKALLK